MQQPTWNTCKGQFTSLLKNWTQLNWTALYSWVSSQHQLTVLTMFRTSSFQFSLCTENGSHSMHVLRIAANWYCSKFSSVAVMWTGLNIHSYFSVAATSWFYLRNNDANDVRINCSCQRVEPWTSCDIIIPTFWIPNSKRQRTVVISIICHSLQIYNDLSYSINSSR